MNLKNFIADVPNFPTDGILFRDITPLLQNGEAFKYACDQIAEFAKAQGATIIVGPESRGFIFGCPVATKLNVGFVPVRKPGKLPRETVQVEYSLEYGKNVLAMHKDVLKPGDKVVIIDDLLATGGTLKATIELIESLGVEVVGCEARVYSSPSVYTEYTSTDGTAYACTHPNKNGYVLIVNNSPEYPYIINYNFEHTEYYNSSGLLAKIVNKQGFITTITYSDVLTTITDTVSGKKIFLEKDSSEKIVKVYDDALRQATFYYEGSLLTTITDLNGKSLCYTYNDDGQIATGTDSKGICYFTNTYDEFGRVKTQKDGTTKREYKKLEDCYFTFTYNYKQKGHEYQHTQKVIKRYKYSDITKIDKLFTTR